MMIRMVAVRADYYGRRQPRRPRRLDARDARRDAPLTMIPPLLPPLLPFPLVHAHLLAPMHARIRATASLAVARRVDTSRKGAMGKGERERGREERSGFQDEHENRCFVVALVASRDNKRCTFPIRIAINTIAFLERGFFFSVYL